MKDLANDPNCQMTYLNQPNGIYQMTNLNPQNARLKKRPKMIDLNPSNNK
jgi:hypothetical protein